MQKNKNMKILSLILFVILNLLYLELFSQNYYPFPDTNTAWNTVGDNDFTPDQWHLRYAMYGDTIINSILYTKVYEMYDSTILHTNSTYFAAIRENENKQIFCLLPGFSESILYDFNLNVGDTIYYNIGGVLGHSEVRFWDENHYRIIIERDSMLMLNNQYRRKWVLEESFFCDRIWIEGIGSINWYGLFNPLITTFYTNGDGYQFACFKQNDTVLYLNNMFCDQCFCQLYTSIAKQNIENKKLITLFPNPSKGKITIQNNEAGNKIHKIEIFDLLGKKQIDKLFDYNNKTEIEIRELKSGLYLIKIYNIENEVLGIKKVIIE